MHGLNLSSPGSPDHADSGVRQGAVEKEQGREVDPENQLLWRMPRRRLDFEAMRDSMLAVCEELDTTIGGRPIDLNATPAVPRRSVYGFVNRDIIANPTTPLGSSRWKEAFARLMLRDQMRQV